MDSEKLPKVGVVAALAWLVIPGYGVWNLVKAGDDDWELAYAIFEVALLVAVALTLVVVAALTGTPGRRPLRVAGLAVGGLGAFLAFVGAWALVLWMPVLGLAFALLALAGSGRQRRLIGLLAAGLFAGFAIQIAGALVSGEVNDGAELIALAVTAAAAVVLLGQTAVRSRQNSLPSGSASTIHV